MLNACGTGILLADTEIVAGLVKVVGKYVSGTLNEPSGGDGGFVPAIEVTLIVGFVLMNTDPGGPKVAGGWLKAARRLEHASMRIIPELP